MLYLPFLLIHTNCFSSFVDRQTEKPTERWFFNEFLLLLSKNKKRFLIDNCHKKYIKKCKSAHSELDHAEIFQAWFPLVLCLPFTVFYCQNTKSKEKIVCFWLKLGCRFFFFMLYIFSLWSISDLWMNMSATVILFTWVCVYMFCMTQLKGCSYLSGVASMLR